MNPVKNIVIKSSEGSELFQIGPREGEYINLELRMPALKARARIFLYEDNIGLFRLFEDLAQNWKGWQGVKVWTSLEEDLKLSCSTDGLGHVTIALEVTNRTVGSTWIVKASLKIDAGSLEQITHQAKTLLSD
jgi:hypothetical protein